LISIFVLNDDFFDVQIFFRVGDDLGSAPIGNGIIRTAGAFFD